MSKVDIDERCKSLGPRSVRCVLPAGHSGGHEAYYFTWESNADHRETDPDRGAKPRPCDVSWIHE